MRPIPRRSMLQAVALASVAADPLLGASRPSNGAATTSADPGETGAGGPVIAPATPAAVPVSVLVPPHGEREPAGTEVVTVNGTGVVFQYDAVVPSFDGWRTREPTRDYLSLDRDWRFRFDPEGVGETRGWHQPSFGDAGWDTIAVPSSWDLLDTPGFGGYDGSRFGEGTAFADGYAWYRVEVRTPGSWAARHVRLAFLAANYRADIWLDGRHLGAHEGGHAPFALPVGDALRPGRPNLLAVRIHRRASYEDYTQNSPAVTDELAIPWKPVDYWPYAGLTRSAWFEAVPRTSVAKLLLSAGDGRLDARAVVENHGDEPFTGQVVFDPGPGTGGESVRVPVTVEAGGASVARATVAIPSARPWRSENPVVLRAKASLLSGSAQVHGAKPVDVLSSRYGMRTVAVGDAKLLTNGEPTFLKGLNWHEESATHGRSMTRAEYDRELGQVQAMRANAVRNCVYTRHPYVYDWADEHGVWVMDDIDTMWMNTAQEKLQTEQYGLSRAMALAMAWNQHNHPSVVCWCVHNESEYDGGGAPVYRAWIADMKAAIKAVDLAGRPVTWASSSTFDPAFDLADVIGFNEYFGYFYGRNEDLGPAINDVHRRYPDKPIIITENGSWSFLGHHGPDTEAGTEEWQAANFRLHWAQVVERKEYVAGYLFWVLKDYKERLAYNEEYNGISTMGTLGFDSVTPRLVHGDIRAADIAK